MKGTWVQFPDSWSRLPSRGAVIRIPRFDPFTLLMLRVEHGIDPDCVAKVMEDELVRRNPNLQGAQVVGFGWSLERNCALLTVLHSSLSPTEPGQHFPEIVLPPPAQDLADEQIAG